MVVRGRLPLTKSSKYCLMGYLEVNPRREEKEDFCRICFGGNHRTRNCTWIFRDLNIQINVIGVVAEPYDIDSELEEKPLEVVAGPSKQPQVERTVAAAEHLCVGCGGKNHTIRNCDQWVAPEFLEPKLRPEWDGPRPAVEGCFNCLQTGHQTRKCPYPRMDDHCFRCGLQQVTCATCDRCYDFWRSLGKFHKKIGCCMTQEQYEVYLKTGLVPRKNLYVAKRPTIVRNSKLVQAKRH